MRRRLALRVNALGSVAVGAHASGGVQCVVSYLDTGTLRVGCGSACIFLDDTTARPRLYCYSQPILLAQTLP